MEKTLSNYDPTWLSDILRWLQLINEVTEEIATILRHYGNRCPDLDNHVLMRIENIGEILDDIVVAFKDDRAEETIEVSEKRIDLPKWEKQVNELSRAALHGHWITTKRGWFRTIDISAIVRSGWETNGTTDPYYLILRGGDHFYLEESEAQMILGLLGIQPKVE